MRAFTLESYDGPHSLRVAEVPQPVPGDDHVLLEVKAIGINFPDLLMTKGLYQLRPELPVVPGCEVAGIVRSAPYASRWQVGDRAAAFVWHGGFAEYVVVPVETLAPIDDGVDFDTAAAMIVNYHTALFALDYRGRLQSGESVLVMGAAGGIGSAAVQIARGLGARVVAGIADDSQNDTARQAGADDVLVLREGFSEEVKTIVGGAVDVVVDPLGDWLFGEAVRTLGPQGRILVIGFAAGSIPTLKVNRLLLRNISAVGVAWGAFLDVDPGLVPRQAERLSQLSRDGFTRPLVGSRYSFEELPHGLDELDRGLIDGKGVVTLEAGSPE